MNEEKELEAWRAAWQSLGGESALAAELAAQAAKDARRVWVSRATETLAALASTSVSLVFAIRSHGRAVTVALCAGIALFNAIWLTRLFTLRVGAGEGSTVAHFVALRRARLERDRTWNAFARRATIGLGVALVPWSLWMLRVGWALYRAEPWRFVVGFGGVLVILAGVLVTLSRAQKRLDAERERFEALVAERTLV